MSGRARVRRWAAPAIVGLGGVVCALVAWLLDAGPLAALAGAALVVAYWALELAAAALGARGSFSQAMLAGVVGMVVRIALVTTVLLAVGIVARGSFAPLAVSFLFTYTVYQAVRLWSHPALAVGGAAARPDRHARG